MADQMQGAVYAIKTDCFIELFPEGSQCFALVLPLDILHFFS